MLDNIKDFQKVAKAAGRDENSLEELKAYLEATEKRAEEDDYEDNEQKIIDAIVALTIDSLPQEDEHEVVIDGVNEYLSQMYPEVKIESSSEILEAFSIFKDKLNSLKSNTEASNKTATQMEALDDLRSKIEDLTDNIEQQQHPELYDQIEQGDVELTAIYPTSLILEYNFKTLEGDTTARVDVSLDENGNITTSKLEEI